MEGTQRHIEKLLGRLDGCTILVEGKHDIKALRDEGITAPIIAFARKPSEVAVKAVATAKGGRIVLLYDNDVEGRRKEAEMRALLEGDAGIDVALRKRFYRLFGCKCVEHLPAAIRRLRQMGEKNG